MNHLLVICGPTGSGKSSLALDMAREFSGEIINCDSLQVYRHFDIGTAKLPESERCGIVHHLIDAVEPCQSFTAGDFSSLGRHVIAEIIHRSRLPIVAGGTGFYLRALLDGLSPGPPRSGPLRLRLQARETRRPGSLHLLLRKLDPPAAARIHPHDSPKLIRALEIDLLAPHTSSTQPMRDRLDGYRILKLALFPPRDPLRRLLDHRCAAMFSGGLLEEVQRILNSGVPATAKPFESLGYKQALAHLEGRITLGAAIEDAQRATRQYAKRQATWFRKEVGAVPLHGFGNDPAIQSEARALTRQLLNSS